MKIKNAKLTAGMILMAVLLLASNSTSFAAIDIAKLGTTIYNTVTNDSPKTDINGWYGSIAFDCKDAPNNAGLNSKLVSEFKSIPSLDYANNTATLNQAAKDIADAQFPAAAPPPPADPLPPFIAKCLDQCPGIDTNQMNGWTGYIASLCSGVADNNSLQATLINAFASDPKLTWLNFAKNRTFLEDAAAQIANEKIPAPNPINAVTPSMPKNNTGWTNWLVSLSSGAEFQNPYFISVPNGSKFGTLTNSGNKTVAYVQFEVMRRGVFAPDRLPDNLNNFWDGFTLAHPTIANWTPDLQFDVGFLIGNSANTTNKTYSAQTLAGSDIFLNFGAGIPIFRNNWQTNDPVAVQVSLGGSVGMTTEESFEKIHVNEFLGGVLDIALSPNVILGGTNSYGTGLFEAKIGYGHLDFPSMTGTANQVNLDGNGTPVFNERWAPEMGVNVLLPIRNAIYLNVEANAFLADQTPDQWNVKVGVTVPFSTVGTLITGLGL